MGARRYLLSKLLQALATLLFVLVFNFFLFRVLPGDPIGLLARSQRLTEADIAEQRATLGLDEPLPRQYLTYVRQTVSGNLGVSLRTARPVWDIIGSRAVGNEAAGSTPRPCTGRSSCTRCPRAGWGCSC